jgi:hypothetical protein
MAREAAPTDSPLVTAVSGNPAGPDAPRRHRRWPWIVAGAVLVVLAGAGVLAFGGDRAHEVTMNQAEQRLGEHGGGVAGARPAPGVYRYKGSGTERLSFPPLSQSEGPLIPGTVTLSGANCWVFRLDYSSHHWQTWDYCRHGADTWEAGGQTWQLWSIGPINESNTSTFTCAPGTMSLPATAVPGQVWHGRCTGTNTAVSGTTVSEGPYRFVGLTTLSAGGTSVRTAEFVRNRTDSGAQSGSEHAEVWLDASTGLPVRLRQDITVTTDTPFGRSTYTQSGVLTLTSPKAQA